ncbi:hypothetical protein [Photobacterium damselae]|uniref:Uncharacterized protein n=2 Tax=Photobacterium damselae TaxID=38293 RepID=D0Z4Y2_PHODD|nr:hypothetical protein [Photobacterium damselae]EEZ39199.1 hypothetical protein VDA_000215 [Photobacterium damselae subsp. damselae CIP 102761]PSW78589.1 hypothetical protein CTN07_20945 [Photobacterium damselae]SPY45067.1 Uncharacterised protein [Photobacterium damselae]
MKKLLPMTILLALSSAANASQDSVFPDFIDPSLTACTDIRLSRLVRKGTGEVADVAVGQYEYNANNKITKREYLDSTFTYEYNDDGTLNKASALRKPDGPGIIIRHTNESFISEYTYNNGRVASETKKVFSASDTNLDGEPEATYTITYHFDDQGKLIRRNQVNSSNNNNVFYTYTYNQQGQLSKINEERKSGNVIADRNIILLSYNTDGEIIKAIHKKPLLGNVDDVPPVIKTVNISYYDSNDDVYPFHYVDPVKEWKIDRDYFGLSYHQIQSITTTEADKVTTANYTYTDTNDDFLPDTFTVNLKITKGEQLLYSVNQPYDLLYPAPAH